MTNETSGISRRTLAKGAAWAVPAVAVAAATPAMAQSDGPLEFGGGACKLPGNSNDLVKGYVFELIANNTTGPNPTDAITVITDVKVLGASTAFIVVLPDGAETCSCAVTCAGGSAANSFCTPDGLLGQRILIYTATQASSADDASFSVTYQRYDCAKGCAPFGTAQTITATFGTPPVNGQSCPIRYARDHQPGGTTPAAADTATAPEATAPEATAPEATAPEATAPEATAPEATAPEATAPEASAPEVTVAETAAETTN